MKRINPWRLTLGLLAGLALAGGAVLEFTRAPGTAGMPLIAAGLGLGALWLLASAICWQIRADRRDA